MEVLKTIKEWFFPTIKETPKPFEVYTVEVTIPDVIDSDGSLTPILDLIAKVFGFDVAEITFLSDRVYIDTFDPETGEIHRSEVYDANPHIIDYLRDVHEGRVQLGATSVSLMYAGVL